MSDGTMNKLSVNEPVAWVSAITNGVKTLVLAVIALALAFDWVNWSDEQNAAVIGVVAALFVLLSGVATAIVRQKVTPTGRLSDGADGAAPAVTPTAGVAGAAVDPAPAAGG